MRDLFPPRGLPRVSDGLSRARTLALARVRRGRRPVAWTPEFMGFGNLLFVALWVDLQRHRGIPAQMLITPAAQRWLPDFPALQELMITRRQVRFLDDRVRPWRQSEKELAAAGGDSGPFERGVSDEQFDSFVRRYLVAAPRVQERLAALPDPACLVVNVRRGDYYSVPEIRAQYGFNVEEYVRVGVRASIASDGPPSSILLVSDDLDWCRDRLGWLAEIAPVREGIGSPMDNFIDVAASRRIVMTNSTFSYWAGYLSAVAYGDNHRSIVVPRFFDRTQNEGRGWLFDHRWQVIEDIPGGWAESTSAQ